MLRILRHLSYAAAAVPALFLVASFFAVSFWIFANVVPAAFNAEDWPEPEDGTRTLMKAGFVALVLQLPGYLGWALFSRRLTLRLRFFWMGMLSLFPVFAIPLFLFAMWRRGERAVALRLVPHPNLRRYLGKVQGTGPPRRTSPGSGDPRLRPEYRRVRFRCERSEIPPSFFVITAHNPDGRKVDGAANERADDRFRKLLGRLRFEHFPVTGGSLDFSHAEPGHGVVATREQALSLARHFRQEAVYEIREGRVFLVSALDPPGLDEDIGPWVVLSAPLPGKKPPLLPLPGGNSGEQGDPVRTPLADASLSVNSAADSVSV